MSRRSLAALLEGGRRAAALFLCAVLAVSFAVVTLAPHSSAAPAAPDSPAGQTSLLKLERVTPALGPGMTLDVEISLRNISGRTLSAPRATLGILDSPARSREELSAWASRTDTEETGRKLATTGKAPREGAEVIPALPSLAPDTSAKVRFSLPADSLNLPTDPREWGPRRISITLTDDGGQPLSVLRTFLVWIPSGVTPDRLSYSFLLPITTRQAAEQILAPDDFRQSVEGGRLHSLLTLAQRPEVDWLLDPSLLDPPMVFPKSAQAAASSASPSTEAGVSASPMRSAADYAEKLSRVSRDRTVLLMPYQNVNLPAIASANPATTAAITAQVAEATKRSQEESGIHSDGSAIRLSGSGVNTKLLHAALDADPQTLIASSADLPGKENAVTPSGIASANDGEHGTRMLVSDARLSGVINRLTPENRVLSRQRILADTALIAAQPTAQSRQILIVPQTNFDPTSDDVNSVLDALSGASWLAPARTSRLLAADTAVTEPVTDPASRVVPAAGPLLTHGTVRELTGSGKPDEPVVTENQLATIESANLRLQKLATVSSSFGQPRVSDPLVRSLLAIVGPPLRGSSDDLRNRLQETTAQLSKFYNSVQVLPASSYNLVSSSAGVPVTVENKLPTSVQVRPSLKVSRPILKIAGKVEPVTIAPYGQATVTIPVEALMSGKVDLTISLATVNDVPLGDTQTVSLVVNPEWENTTTLVLVLGMAALVTIGVVRARRTRSETRAPAERGAEEVPDEQAREDAR
ncbi:hypothetical protein KRX56_00680 [Dermabacteraceae bacterium TAE3-ERU27]|nr:hypothetical protein [Dermabacteraceae bacterium TAE3-ERU27]